MAARCSFVKLAYDAYDSDPSAATVTNGLMDALKAEKASVTACWPTHNHLHSFAEFGSHRSMQGHKDCVRSIDCDRLKCAQQLL